MTSVFLLPHRGCDHLSLASPHRNLLELLALYHFLLLHLNAFCVFSCVLISFYYLD